MENIFIYKIEHNILGVGILPEQSNLNTILKFEIEFFIIMEEYFHYNSKSEIEKIFQNKDLEKYLNISRKINFSNKQNNKLEMKQENKQIGFLYILNDFQLELYWKRSREKYKEKIEERKREE